MTLRAALLGSVLAVTLACPDCGHRLHNEAGGVAFSPPRRGKPAERIRCAWCERDYAPPEWPGTVCEDDPR